MYKKLYLLTLQYCTYMGILHTHTHTHTQQQAELIRTGIQQLPDDQSPPLFDSLGEGVDESMLSTMSSDASGGGGGGRGKKTKVCCQWHN